MSELELRWMNPASAAAAAAVAPWSSGGLIARDRASTYWHVSPAGRWSAFRDGGWAPGEAPTTMMEVPADVPDLASVGSAWPSAEAAEATGLTAIGAAIERLHALHGRGFVTSGDVEDSLGRLHVIDVGGAAWTRGFRSGAWYRWSGGRWSERPDGPDPDGLLTAAEFIMACPACGAEADGRRFCGDCGAEQPTSRVTTEVGAALGAFLENGYGTIPEPVTASWDPPAAPTVGGPAAASSVPLTPPPVASAPLPPTPAPVAPPAPARPTRARRPLLPLLSTLLGSALLAVSGVRLALAVTGGGPFSGGEPSAAPTDVPAASVAPVDPSPQLTAEPSAEPSIEPAPSAEPGTSLWFSDTFDEAGAFPTGALEFASAAVLDGRYVIEPVATDLPIYLWGISEGSPGATAFVEATVTLPATGAIEAGVVAEDVAGLTRVMFQVAPDGRWYLFVDDFESFRTAAFGRSDAIVAGGPNRLGLGMSPFGVAVTVNGTVVGSADVSLEMAGFGIAVRALEEGTRLEVDDYTVTFRAD